jgi:hypothetical protein
VESNNTTSIKIYYFIMKLHVPARSGHRQVSHHLRGIVVISIGVWGRDLYLSSPGEPKRYLFLPHGLPLRRLTDIVL